MKAGEVYKNKREPELRLMIVWVSGDNCKYEMLDGMGDFIDYSCTISELLELYEREW